MDVQATKIDLIHWLTELQDTDVLQQLAVIKSGKDWWDDISEEEKLAIDEGIAQLDRGESISHEEVMRQVKEKLDKTLKEKLTSRTLKANENIKNGEVYTRKEAEEKLINRIEI